jgi:hypothetical protein
VVAVAMTAVFALGPIFGLPLIGRYLRTPAILLALFYGLAVFGWALLPQGRARRRWFAAGMLALALSVAYVPTQTGMLDSMRKGIKRDGRLYADLRLLGEAQVVRSAFRACQPLTAGDHRPIPYLRYWLDGKPSSVGTVEKGARSLGRVLVLPRPVPHVKNYYKQNFPHVRFPASYQPIYANGSWRVLAAPGCGTAR